jgi:hypothetical protein
MARLLHHQTEGLLGRMPMPRQRRAVKAATQQRDHNHLLFAVLYLGGVVLLFNAWLISQNLIGS